MRSRCLRLLSPSRLLRLSRKPIRRRTCISFAPIRRAVAPDIFVRFYAEKLRPVIGRTIIVENKPGAVSNIATEYVARAKPDGYTVYIQGASSIAANMHLFRYPPVDVGRAIQIAAPLNKQPYMLVVDASRPWKHVAELTAYLKDMKDKASY